MFNVAVQGPLDLGRWQLCPVTPAIIDHCLSPASMLVASKVKEFGGDVGKEEHEPSTKKRKLVIVDLSSDDDESVEGPTATTV